jgi:hypothetical protein
MKRFFPRVLAVALICALAVPASRVIGAVGASDIPGVPLSSSSVRDEVGGDIFDRVYSLAVSKGAVLLATIRGEQGAEIGLYIFSSDSGSILTDEPLASSAQPGADQSISLQFFADTTIYIDVNGRNTDRAYAYTLTTTVVIDRSPPVIKAFNTSTTARSSNVCGYVDAYDRISGIDAVALHLQSGVDEPAWITYEGARSYCTAFELAEGRQTFELLVRNGVGLVSRAASTSVTIDNTSPRLTSLRPTSHVVLSPRGTISWLFNEPVRLVGAKRRAIFAVNQDGSVLAGSTSFNATGSAIEWTPRDPLPPGTVYTASLAAVTDRAGNLLATIEPQIVYRKAPVAISLSLARLSASSVRVTIFTSKNLIGESLTLESKSNRSIRGVKRFSVTSRQMTFNLDPRAAGQFRLVWGGSEAKVGSVSPWISLP